MFRPGPSTTNRVSLCAYVAQRKSCATKYAKGYGAITSTLEEMNAWMDSHKVARVSDLKGRLARQNSASPELYGRLHYVKALRGQA